MLVAVAAGLLAGCTASSSAGPSASTRAGNPTAEATCLTQPTATVRVGNGSAQVVQQAMTLTVRVGQPISVTYNGECLGGARLILSKPGPGSGLNDYSQTVAEGVAVQQWKPAEPGTRNLMVGWSCSGPIPCPFGYIGIITVTTPTPAG